MKTTANIENLRLGAVRQITNILDAAQVVDEESQKSRARGYINYDLETVGILLTDTASSIDEILNTYHEAMKATFQHARTARAVADSALRELREVNAKNSVAK